MGWDWGCGELIAVILASPIGTLGQVLAVPISIQLAANVGRQWKMGLWGS